MIAKLTRRLALVFSIVVACASCGSGVEVAGQLLAQGGIGGSGIVFGPVSTITSSSIVVNDVTWDISAAEITIDGKSVSNPGLQDQGQSKLGIFASGLSNSKLAPAKDRLEEGMVVTVEGTIDGDTGIATAVAAEHVINGAVQEVIDAYSIKVRGQIVQVDAATLLPDILDLSALTPNEHVRVSGLVKGNGVIAATRIELAGGVLGRFRVEGFTEATTEDTFRIGNHIVHWRKADISGLNGDPVDGLLVEVEERNPDVIGPLSLDEIDLEGLGVTEANQVRINGFVSEIMALSAFELGNQPVQITPVTLLAGGVAGDIVKGAELEVKGVLVDSVLIATKVSFPNNVLLESDVDTLNAITKKIALAGLPEITVATNSLTEFIGVGGFDDIRAGDHLLVRGRIIANDEIIATRLSKRSPSDAVTLQGSVNAVADPIVVVLGATVDSSSFVDDQFKGLNDLPIGRAAFFDPTSGTVPGRLVKAQGVLLSSVVSWDQVEIED
ncbi:MAG: hypothetical protein E2O38_06530 [Proteobacteria bacterium]|nr:MAG: hypothetical protein E2O38_06530 [Pseudomonadota bacterium]